MSVRQGAAGIRPSLDAALALVLAAALVALSFISTGGFDGAVSVSAGDTWSAIALVLLGSIALVAMLVLSARAPAWGGVTVALFALLTAYTALSISWSVEPDASWQAANLTLAYLITFAAAAALARIAPERWRVLVGALALTAVVLSAYALLTKVFPGSLDASDTQGRLQTPLGYWNATGAMAVVGIVPCLWAFTRREGSALLRGLAVPGASVLATVVILSYSRTALAVAVLAIAAWLILAPDRLRAAAMLGLAGAGTAVLSAWALSHAALTGDHQLLPARTSDGHTFGFVLVVVLALLAVAGTAAIAAGERRGLTDTARRRVGTVLVGFVALLPVLAVIALAVSSRGLTGQISHAWSSLTSVNSTVGNSAARVTELGSSRPLYWSEGITVGDHAALKGVGALGYATARLRYTHNPSFVSHAHSYLVQTYADLGVLGLLLSLAVLAAWVVAALRSLGGLRNRPRAWESPAGAERAGLLAILIVVVAYGLISAADWTWYFPAVTAPAMLAAGWLAGRGPLAAPVGRDPQRGSILSRPAVAAGVGTIAVLALVGCWLIWQPLRSADAASAALSAGTRGASDAAFANARSAVSADPLALQPHLVLSSLYTAAGDQRAAREELVSATRLQPDNPESWLQLGLFDLQNHQPRGAVVSLQRASALDLTDVPAANALAAAQAALAKAPG